MMLTEACNSDKCHCPRRQRARAEGQYLRPRVNVTPSLPNPLPMAIIAFLIYFGFAALVIVLHH